VTTTDIDIDIVTFEQHKPTLINAREICQAQDGDTKSINQVLY